MKIWTSEKKDDDKIIAYLNDVVYKANPPSGEIADVVAELKTSERIAILLDKLETLYGR